MLASIFSLNVLQTALELGCIYALVALALFLSYSILNIADLSTDGCFTLGCAVACQVALTGHPILALVAAMAAGVCSGFVTAFLQTRLGVESIMAGIIVNTGLYTINLAVMGFSSTMSLVKTDTVFSLAKGPLSFLGGWYKLAIALVIIVLAGAAAMVYGIISWRNGGDFGMYFALFGFAAIFFFSGAHVLPTAKNNKKAVARAWEEAQANLAHVLPDDFPLPARYAHPVVLTRMIRILREGRAQSADEALEVLKTDLKALNADVQVSQEEYDEVVAIKSMFLLSDYQ